MKYIFPACIFILLVSCGAPASENTRAFYYWQSDFHLDGQEKQLLSDLGIRQLYIKFFDVEWDEQNSQPSPTALIRFHDPLPGGMHYVPVIFITNQCMEAIPDDGINELALRISRLLSALMQQGKLPAPHMIQLDCDWTQATREKYFTLIDCLKKYPGWKNITWSATIRLHQVKFADLTGVPPVDRGMLMFYNMGDIENMHAVNSIYEKNIAARYTDAIAGYPLPLDAAVACFSWGLLFEQGKLYHIFYPLYPYELKSDTAFIPGGENYFAARHSMFFHGTFLNAGDSIKLETMTPERSRESAVQLASHLKTGGRDVILYHLDSVISEQYGEKDFEHIFRAFH